MSGLGLEEERGRTTCWRNRILAAKYAVRRVCGRFPCLITALRAMPSPTVGYKIPGQHPSRDCNPTIPAFTRQLSIRRCYVASSLLDQHSGRQRGLRRSGSSETLLQPNVFLPVPIASPTRYNFTVREIQRFDGLIVNKLSHYTVLRNPITMNSFLFSPCASAFLFPSASPRATFPRRVYP